MTYYGIYVTEKVFNIFENGNRKLVSVSQGWYHDSYYDNMKLAKESLANAKYDLDEEDFDEVVEINSVTLMAVRESDYGGERFAPVKQEVKVVYHIQKRTYYGRSWSS